MSLRQEILNDHGMVRTLLHGGWRRDIPEADVPHLIEEVDRLVRFLEESYSRNAHLERRMAHLEHALTDLGEPDNTLPTEGRLEQSIEECQCPRIDTHGPHLWFRSRTASLDGHDVVSPGGVVTTILSRAACRGYLDPNDALQDLRERVERIEHALRNAAKWGT